MTNLPDIPSSNLHQVLAGSILTAEPPNVLQILGLGSCVAVTFYVPQLMFGAMAHVMLPTADNARTPDLKGKYADSAVPELLRIIKKKKVRLDTVQVKLVGGARMFTQFSSEIFDISQRNIEAVERVLGEVGLTVSAKDLGGSRGRSIYFFPETGEIQVYFAGGKLKQKL